MAARDLGGRRCLITGAASGIGRATAIAAARKGADLYLTDIAAEGLDRVAAEIAAAGGRVSWHRAADVSDHAAVVAMAAEVHAAHGSTASASASSAPAASARRWWGRRRSSASIATAPGSAS